MVKCFENSKWHTPTKKGRVWSRSGACKGFALASDTLEGIGSWRQSGIYFRKVGSGGGALALAKVIVPKEWAKRNLLPRDDTN
ncbi:hypothetical protein [Helicobacter sp. MIT 99-10781]|uniref:hypothetical protein n=1 Tax=Helicobacter sp. MIT 99-10781 TaxID=1332285 RepID=UPI0011C01A68|nr:hypothetical protein [Helicobacter sp. MIT 99-10781]